MLKDHLDAWNSINPPDEIIEWISSGVTFSFKQNQHSFDIKNHKLSKAEVAFVDGELNSLLLKGAISKVDYKPHCINPIGCVPKKGKKFRLITDLRQLNNNIYCPYFKNEGIETVCDYLKPNDQFITVDLESSFHHIPINEQFRTFLGFSWRNQFYVWNVLPFGLNVSPWHFNKVIRAVVTYIRKQNIRFVMFVDDGILMSKECDIETEKYAITHLFDRLGLKINIEKSSLIASSSKQFIGYIISSVHESGRPWISIPKDRIQKLHRDIKRTLSCDYVKARFLARICGQCISFAKAILPAKLLLRNLYSVLSRRSSWSDSLILTEAAKSDLKWWLHAVSNWNGRKVEKKVIDGQMFTDASDIGWGAVYNGNEAQGLWTKTQTFKSINQRELLAVLLGILSFADLLRGKHIQVVTDNISTVAYLNHMGGPSQELSQIDRAIWVKCTSIGLTLEAKHLAGKLNTHADHLSRINPQSTYSWSMHPRIFHEIDRIWGPHTVDRFADITNFKCKIYNSLFFDPLSAGVDALAQLDWTNHNNFVNCPFALIPKVLQVIISQRASATLIAPYWPSQPWFPILTKLLVRSPLRLPRQKCMWILGKNPEPLKNRGWKMYAWRISGANDC